MWALSSASAFAFTETPVRTPDKAPAAEAAPKPTVPPAKSTLKAPEDEVVQGEKGIELTIPGVGSLGFLPKLDFGLELLYGANNGKIEEDDAQADDPTFTIRGTVKRKF